MQVLERDLYVDLLTAIQDILFAHDKTAGETLTSWGRLLPELLDAVVCDDMPAVCRRELTNCIGAVVDSRSKQVTANITKFKDLLMSDDYNSTNAVVLGNKRYVDMPSTLAAFSGVLDTCGDFATQINAVQILHAAGKVGGLNPSLVAKGFGDVKKTFLALVQTSDVNDDDFLTKIQDLVTEYNISRGGNAR